MRFFFVCCEFIFILKKSRFAAARSESSLDQSIEIFSAFVCPDEKLKMSSFNDEVGDLSSDTDFQKSIAAQQAKMEFQQQVSF